MISASAHPQFLWQSAQQWGLGCSGVNTSNTLTNTSSNILPCALAACSLGEKPTLHPSLLSWKKIRCELVQCCHSPYTQQYTTPTCQPWQKQHIPTTKVVDITCMSIVGGDNPNNWNKPLKRWESCKHFYHYKTHTIYVSPPKKQGDVWWVMRQSAITFEPKGSTGSPAYSCVGLTMENLFKEN